MDKNLKPRYRANLIRQQSLCERNFHKLRHILPDLDSCDALSLDLQYRTYTGMAIFQVISRAPFTLELDVDIDADWNDWINTPGFRIRMYLDVRMAEIIAINRQRHFQPLYDYPNKQMHQPDEKEQLNQLLAEWLNFCLTYGLSSQKIL